MEFVWPETCLRVIGRGAGKEFGRDWRGGDFCQQRLEWLIRFLCDEALRTLLAEIAAAPITPELLPGAAANDSEARLGPYELHDFFLFHYLADGASAAKLRELAQIAFADKYASEVVDDTLAKFLRRFRAAQYKRNCVPDGPKITLSLSPRTDWRMPSDM